ncbi:hypothetical protein GYMLUDRAFT_715408 [Collybiopsis luxurians FD-317 M1]|nr:hypothetical protein GYMLUDRAFT_715408 [Collybiopsis luxurians FD-317 M1]
MSTTNSKSLRGRLGTAVRRTSSVLSLTRPTTPATPPVSTPKPSQTPTGRARSSSVATSNSETSSVGRPSVDTSPHAANPDSAPPTNSVPSPIAESPAREAAATAEEIRDGLQSNQPKAGPTPLAEVVTAPTETETPVETVESSQSGPREQTIIGSASGPHTFTEEPDEMSLRGSRTIESVESAPIPNPLPELSEAPKPEARAAPEIPAPAVTDAAPSYFEIPTHPPAEPVLDSSALKNAINENTMGTTTSDGQPTLDRQLSDQTTPRPHGPADTENASVFYAFSEMPVPAPAPPQATTEELPAPSYNIDAASTSEGVPASDPLPVPQNPRQVEEDPDVVQMPAPEVTGPVEPAPAPSVIQWVPQKTAEENAAISIPAPTFVPYDAGSSEEAWASQPAAQKNQETLGRQLADNSTQTLQDPFADPVPSIHISTIDTGPSSMPE